MKKSGLFRVLAVDDGQLSLNPVAQQDEGTTDSSGEQLIIDTTDVAESLSPTVSLLEPGHLVRAELNVSDSSVTFRTIEHRGGFTLVELDPRMSPFLLQTYLGEEGEQALAAEKTERTVVTLYDDVESPFDGETPAGELVVCRDRAPPGSSWDDFVSGRSSESIYGEFEELPGSPSEVFISNPHGTDYWCVMLFAEDGSSLASGLRAQFGESPGSAYVPNPAWDILQLIDPEALPDDIEDDPRGILSDEYNIRSSHLPSQFGIDTVNLIAEFLFVGAQFDFMLSDGPASDLDPKKALKSDAASVNFDSADIISVYEFYAELLKSVYERVAATDMSAETIDDQEPMPGGELLHKTRVELESRVYAIECYLEKMEAVDLEAYVIPASGGDSPVDQKELREELGVNLSGLHIVIKRALYDIRFQLDDLKDIFKIADKLVQVESRGNAFKYDVSENPAVYKLIGQHSESVSNGTRDVEMGGEGPGVMMFLLGRLQRRHRWLDASSLGAGGILSGGFADAMSDQMKDKA